MDLLSLQPGHSQNLPAGHQLSTADSATSVRSVFDPATPGLPDKTIAQRWCIVDRPGGTHSAESDSDYVDARADIDNSDDEYLNALDHPWPPTAQQQPEPQTSRGDGPWQVVTRRRSGRKQQQSAAGKGGDARVKKGTRKKGTSARQLTENSSAGNGGCGQNKPVGNAPVTLLPITSCWYWPLCIRSFAQLCKVDWVSFHTRLMKLPECEGIRITRQDFQRFHDMMTEGLQAIKGADDAFFLVGLFRVLMSEFELSSYALLLSLLIERIVPGFLSQLGERFIASLSWLDRDQKELITAVTELLARLCQEDPRWLDRLGWQKYSTRHQCNLFATITLLSKRTKMIDLLRKLHQRVSMSRLEKIHYASMQKLTRLTERSNPDPLLRDIRSSIRAIFCHSEGQLSTSPENRDLPRLVALYADIIENVIEVVDGHALPLNSALFGLWQVIAYWSFHYRSHLRSHLGFDRTIALLSRQLEHIHCWPKLERQAFELRLTLLEAVLLKCEGLLVKRDSTQFSQAWHEHRNLLVSLLARCNQFMGHYQTPNVILSQADRVRHEEDAQREVLLMESRFFRLDCAIRKPARQQLEKHLHMFHEAFDKNWALSCHYLEIGTLELAKWFFLVGKRDEAISCLMEVCFNHFKLGWKKANLLADHGEYQAAIDEFRRVQSLITDSNKADCPTQNDIDDRVAMTQLLWYQAGLNTDHLICAYRISVDLLGRCDIQDRMRFQGVLIRIVNAMKRSGLRFEDYVGQTSVLDFLAKDGCGIKSWQHFANLLYIRHKLGLTSADSVNKVADGVGRKIGLAPELVNASQNLACRRGRAGN